MAFRLRIIKTSIVLYLLLSLSFAQEDMKLEWVREYTGAIEQEDARAIAVDDSGNVIVGITSFDTTSDYGFTIIKYNSSRDILWNTKYEGDNPESGDRLSDITIDKGGNVYVTGSSQFIQSEPFLYYRYFVTIKYNAQGEMNWLVTYKNESSETWGPNHLTVDSSGNVYVQGNYGTGILLKYDSSGTLLWERNFDNERVTGYYDKCMVMDTKANIYIADKDFSVLKYDSAGNKIWSVGDDSLANGDIYQADIFVDDLYNIYLTGLQKYSDYSVYITVKYDSGGNLKWIRKLGGELFYNYKAFCISVDNYKNVYVSGYVFTEYVHDDQFVTVKYDSNGSEIWVEKFDGPSNTWGNIWNMDIDNLNNIYIIGKVTNYTTNNDDLTILKYDANGNLVFSDYYSEPDRDEEAAQISIDNNNNVFVLGKSRASGKKVLLLKYSHKSAAINQDNNILPIKYRLHQNYPNPFNSSTTISFTLPKTLSVNLSTYDLLGREVKVLINRQMPAGKNDIIFDANDLSSGVYFYRLEANNIYLSRKFLLIK